MPKVVFVILHYLTYDDTNECIKSIKSNIIYKNFNIVVIDNASNNNSFEKIEKKYGTFRDVFLLKNDKNLGFAKGNNIGYKFAKENLKANFIVVINNDTLIKDKNFLNEIIGYYNKSKFHVLGPKIISLQDNCNQNPLKYVIDNKFDLRKNIVKYFILYIVNIIKLEKIFKYLKRKIKNIEMKVVDTNISSDDILVNVPLHGSCLIFSEKYIGSMKYAFYPETFLFVEEDILYYLCQKNKFKICYFPNTYIYHKEDSSTDYFLKSNSKKRRFIYKNIIKSSIEFYKLM